MLECLLQPIMPSTDSKERVINEALSSCNQRQAKSINSTSKSSDNVRSSSIAPIMTATYISGTQTCYQSPKSDGAQAFLIMATTDVEGGGTSTSRHYIGTTARSFRQCLSCLSSGRCPFSYTSDCIVKMTPILVKKCCKPLPSCIEQICEMAAR